MTKKIVKIGNSHGIILDSALMELAHLSAGDEMNLEIHPGGAITLIRKTPVMIEPEQASNSAKRLIEKNNKLFRRLS